MDTATSAPSPARDRADIGEVLRALAGDRRSGVVRIGDPATAWLLLAEGDLVAAGWVAGSGLEETVRVAGAVDDAELRALVHSTGGRDLPLLTALAGAVPVAELVPLVRDRVEAVVFDMLVHPGDALVFAPTDPHELASSFRFPVEPVLDAVTTRVRQWTEIAASIESTSTVFRPVRHLPPGCPTVDLDATRWTVLAALDGRRTVAQVISAAGLPMFTVCSTMHSLVQQGLIERIQ